MPKSVTSFTECRKKILSGVHRGFGQNSVCLVSTLLNRPSPNIGSKYANLHSRPERYGLFVLATRYGSIMNFWQGQENQIKSRLTRSTSFAGISTASVLAILTSSGHPCQKP